jgi:hypothetical protein
MGDGATRSFDAVPARPGRSDRGMDRRSAVADLPALDDLQLALKTCDSIQSSIQHADTKAAILLTLTAGAGALAANDLHTRMPAHTPGAVLAVFAGSAALLGVGLAGALWQLGRCLRPRLAGPPGHNRFALPNLARRGVPRSAGSTGELRREAWRLAETLATIAMSKHRAVRSSMTWLALTVAALSTLHGAQTVMAL